MAKLLENRDLLNAKVSEVMDESFPVLDVDANFEQVKEHLHHSPAVLIEDFKRVTGIITRADVLDLPR